MVPADAGIQPLDVRPLAHVALHAHRATPDLAHGIVQPVLPPPRDIHLRALCGECSCRLEPDALCTACDGDHLACESISHLVAFQKWSVAPLSMRR